MDKFEALTDNADILLLLLNGTFYSGTLFWSTLSLFFVFHYISICYATCDDVNLYEMLVRHWFMKLNERLVFMKQIHSIMYLWSEDFLVDDCLVCLCIDKCPTLRILNKINNDNDWCGLFFRSWRLEIWVFFFLRSFKYKHVDRHRLIDR